MRGDDSARQIVMSQHQRMFQSIVINLEEQNKEMMSRLKGMHSHDAAAGEGMQMQLNRLKSLVETIFSGGPFPGAEPRGGGGPMSLSEPSMVESTPLPRQVECSFCPLEILSRLWHL